jgi:1-deoxy-D-xylulose-5-phosphate synthase
MHHLAETGALDTGLRVRSLVLPDTWLDHDKPERMYAKAGLDAKGIVAKVLSALGTSAAVSAGRSLIA